jgi:6-phosphogluconolactonase
MRKPPFDLAVTCCGRDARATWRGRLARSLPILRYFHFHARLRKVSGTEYQPPAPHPAMRSILHLTAHAILAALAIPLTHARPVYIGTAADGIYQADFDPEKGTLTEPKLAAPYPSPGFLALHPGKSVLYSIGKDNTVAAFEIGGDDSLTRIGSAPCGGAGPCHLAIDATGRTLAVANYGDGSFATIRLDEDGKPGGIASLVKNTGSGPDKQRQNAAHTHGVYFDKANRHLFVPDLGIDKVVIHKFDAASSGLSPDEPAAMVSPPGGGPRHMAFSPDEKHAYVINELTNTVSVAEFDAAEGALTPIQEIATLPDDFPEPNTTSEIEVHPNGNFVYGSNRGHDSIVVYQRDPQTGRLTLLQHAPCGGRTPRHFKIDPSGKWLVCAHQDDNTISVLSLDPATGMLGNPENTVSAPKPICILFR